jgi:hypothetical protein
MQWKRTHQVLPGAWRRSRPRSSRCRGTLGARAARPARALPDRTPTARRRPRHPARACTPPRDAAGRGADRGAAGQAGGAASGDRRAPRQSGAGSSNDPFHTLSARCRPWTQAAQFGAPLWGEQRAVRPHTHMHMHMHTHTHTHTHTQTHTHTLHTHTSHAHASYTRAGTQQEREVLARQAAVDKRAPRADWAAAAFPWDAQVGRAAARAGAGGARARGRAARGRAAQNRLPSIAQASCRRASPGSTDRSDAPLL